MASGFGRGGLQGLIVALLFFGPLLAAFLLYYSPAKLRPAGSVASGELLDPIPTLPVFSVRPAEQVSGGELQRKWWLLYFNPETCGEVCVADLDLIRRVRLLLNEDRSRVGYALITRAAAPATADELLSGWPAGPDAAEVAATLRSHARGQSAVFVLDPHNNLVMRYPARPNPDGLLDDLKRLLRLSRIG